MFAAVKYIREAPTIALQMAVNEVFASILYNFYGVSVIGLHLVCNNEGLKDQDGAVMPTYLVGSAAIDVDTCEPITPDCRALLENKIAGAVEPFLVDCVLANWDVGARGNVGIMKTPYGLSAIRVDVGGCMLYRAMGAPRGHAFGVVPTEHKTFFWNQVSTKLFANMTSAQVTDMARMIDRIKPTAFDRFVKRLRNDIDSRLDMGKGDRATANAIVEKAYTVVKQRHIFYLSHMKEVTAELVARSVGASREHDISPLPPIPPSISKALVRKSIAARGRMTVTINHPSATDCTVAQLWPAVASARATNITLLFRHFGRFDEEGVKVGENYAGTSATTYEWGGEYEKLRLRDYTNPFTAAFMQEYGLLHDALALSALKPWIASQNEFLMNLSTYEILTVQNYTRYGDRLTNSFLRGTFDASKDDKSIRAMYPQILQLLRTLAPGDFNDQNLYGELDEYFDKPVSTVYDALHEVQHVSLTDPDDIEHTVRVIIGLGRYMSTKFLKRTVQLFAEDLHRIVMAAPPVTHEFTLYRGTKAPYFQTKTGRHRSVTFMSTSLSIDVAARFLNVPVDSLGSGPDSQSGASQSRPNDDDDMSGGGRGGVSRCCLQRITVLPQTRALIMFPVSHFASEAEVLLPAGSVQFLQNGRATLYRQTAPRLTCLWEAGYSVQVNDATIMALTPTLPTGSLGSSRASSGSSDPSDWSPMSS